ncbi:prepilin peptidase-dependent protein [Pantoea sp. GD03673]|uniref:prepilin peptidase-dependent protein n=1 Tax=Pantoea sp. GD03673 TaxID=2975364 RepID=UPI002449C9DF|nr:prepilin peptidase-dependent protein [Pantoea sp. GD03673]MDH2068149.1 prepilin peptidase-dependent protein [Pantoea sp. GD03673]
MKIAGFSLLEMLIALAISAVVMLSAGRFLPLLLAENAGVLQQAQLRQELQQIMATLEKAVRRAGYCHGECGRGALKIRENCLLLRWDENSNGKWEAVSHAESDYYGYRLRQQQLEMQRGVDQCQSAGWERLSDPAFMTLQQFSVSQQGALIRIVLQGRAGRWLETVESWVEGVNL